MWAAIDFHPVTQAREAAGREGGPTRRRHRQPVGETHRSGYDAGKKIKGGKRHIVTDTGGLPVAVMAHEADIRDRAGAPDVLASTAISYPWPSHIFAEGGYGGGKPFAARSTRPASGPSKSSSAPIRPRGRVVAPPPGGGAYLRPAGMLPPSGEGCRGNHQKRRCLDYHRQHPPHDQAVGKNLISAQPS